MILVLQSKMNHFAQKALTTFPFTVETFPIEDLLVNITKHIQQPKIEILNKEEKEQLLRKHALEDKQVCLYSAQSFFAYLCMLCFNGCFFSISASLFAGEGQLCEVLWVKEKTGGEDYIQ
jgi:hypothetical protein